MAILHQGVVGKHGKSIPTLAFGKKNIRMSDII
jgi:hypothetical protein